MSPAIMGPGVPAGVSLAAMTDTRLKPYRDLFDGEEFSPDNGATWYTAAVPLFGNVAVYSGFRKDPEAPTRRIDVPEFVLTRSSVPVTPATPVEYTAFLDGGEPEPEIRMTFDDFDADAGMTVMRIRHRDGHMIADLMLDELQVGEWIQGLSSRRHIAVEG